MKTPLSHTQIRQAYKTFWEKNGHTEVPPIPLVPKDDPTTLFTGSGMQQFVPNLLGEPHPQGTRLFNIQPCFRAGDIEEIGDNRHTTCFEMMGNWSLGDYFKKEQLHWLMEFLVEKIGLPVDRLYVSVFKGTDLIPADEESVAHWKEIFQKYGIHAELGERIFSYGAEKNWWSRGGVPEDMPPGEPGGPDSEIFYQFDTPHNPRFRTECHPNCDCGRFMEIGNSVFMEYKKREDGGFDELPKKNVDFGGGFERIVSASHNEPDIFKTDLYTASMSVIETVTGAKYIDENKIPMRIIADHLKAATVMIASGVTPANKQQGYVLRRLLRRSAVKMHTLTGSTAEPQALAHICESIINTYDGELFINKHIHSEMIETVVTEEIRRFNTTLQKGLRTIDQLKTVSGKEAFNLYQTYGFPLELTQELFAQKGHTINTAEFHKEFEAHRTLSRTASAGMFKGGLADHSEQVLRYHTATHLLHQALFDVLGEGAVRQEGSNITGERLRFDFSSTKKPTSEDIEKTEHIVNSHISQALPMRSIVLPRDEALRIGARAFFKEKYPDTVKIYYIGGTEGKPETAYSKEFCGGPHVKNTKEIGEISITKFKKIGSSLYRVYAQSKTT